MAPVSKRKHITWGNIPQRNAEQIVEVFGDDMELHDIPSHTSTRQTGETDINYSGVIQYALMKLAEQARQKLESSE